MKIMKKILPALFMSLLMLALSGCEEEKEIEVMTQPEGIPDFSVKRYAEWAGCRSSCYGMDEVNRQSLLYYMYMYSLKYNEHED